jgi:hypothetical protein
VTPGWQSAAAVLVTDLQRVFSSRLQAVVAYGSQVDGTGGSPLTCLALVTSLEGGDLDACARLAHHWERQGLAVPLILPREEFTRSLDAFPLEYNEILRAHVHVFGDDPFVGVSIARDDLRRACETQVKSHLVHLREGFIEAGGVPHAIAELVTGSAPAFAALLRSVARLSGSEATARLDAARAGATAAGLPDAIVASVLALEHGPTMLAADAARLFPDYLRAVEQLARSVDSWRT